MSKILITGAAGFIGSNLVNYLIDETPHCVVAVDKLTYAGNMDSLSRVLDDSRFSFEQADICDGPRMAAIFESYHPDSVMHLAAESHVDRSIDGPDAFIKTNIEGTYQLLQVARNYYQRLDKTKKQQFRFLHVSTDEVYGTLSNEDPAFTETTAYDPHSPYSASKAASDHLVRAWGTTYGLPVLVTNCSNNYGPNQFPEKLIPVVILKASRGETIPVYGTGENVRDWLFVRDHADALVNVLMSGAVGQTYNIGGNNELQNIELVRVICSILDELLPVKENDNLTSDQRRELNSYADLISFVTDRPGHDWRYAINATKIQEQLGWHPSETAATGFRKTVKWYLENQDWWLRILSGDYQLTRQGISAAEGRTTS